ncbi:transcriptional regulator ATRX-like [Anopheles nili]|uniref:transcriptional regulator ATRX-like n=1 Tax=Anopheles nili TaxID=185578 RepID=UPI00237C18D7|nr:transcriptional regulator ATRX-like [Anopheles nili]
MNQEDDIPARVTRGALRRRSVDQEATPQNPAGASGTPKKSASTSKKSSALNAIQENGSRPATPVTGRASRLRTSESTDTPTSVSNKMLQNLKDAESGTGSGQRSRNVSLTEENVNKLNATFEGHSSSVTVRPRTPARLRASHETLTSANSPQTVQPAVRRSARRNSFTSDDGNSSVQSLPITTPKKHGLRTFKDDVIIEEDASDDRAESVASETSFGRKQRRQSATMGKPASPSPRSATASPLNLKNEATPPRNGSTTKQTPSSSLKTPKPSPRLKNVSFNENTKLDDNSSSFQKTPTAVGKKFVLVLEDLRNSELISVSPKVNVEIKLPLKVSPSIETNPNSRASEAQENIAIEQEEPDSIPPSPKQSTLGENTVNLDVSTKNGDKVEPAVSTSDVSGIETLESSVMDVSESMQTPDRSKSNGEKVSHQWGHTVRGSASKGIDEFSVRKQEEEEKLDKQKEQLSLLHSSTGSAGKKHVIVDTDEDIEEWHEAENDGVVPEEKTAANRNEFVDDEALEVDGYQSGDSLASDLREEMRENEIPDQGEDLGSMDSEDIDEEDEENENDSFIVSDDDDDDEEIDEDKLLEGTGDDLSMSDASPQKNKQKSKPRRRIKNNVDDSEDEQQNEQANISASLIKSSSMSSPKKTDRSLTDVTDTSLLAEKNSEHLPQNGAAASLPNDTVTPVKQNCALITPSSGKKPAQHVQVVQDPQSQETREHSATAISIDETLNSAAEIESSVFDNTTKQNDEVEVDGNMEKSNTEHVDVEHSDVNKSTTFEDNEKTVNVKQTDEESLSKSALVSRKSLPVGETNTKSITASRKSLPANVQVHFQEEVNEVEMGVVHEAENTQKEESIAADKAAGDQDDDDDVVEIISSESAPEKLVQPEQKTEEASKPERKPIASLISAQFYLGASKKHPTAASEVSAVATSTPKQKPSKSTKSPSNKESSLVRNPFALAASAKGKARLSMDLEVVQSPKNEKAHHSLPPKLIEESGPSGEAEISDGLNKTENLVSCNGVAVQQPDPEPMEVDEEDENEEEKAAADKGVNDEDGENIVCLDDGDEDDVNEEQKTVTKMPKPKAKALEDYDMASIMSRCNEFVRVDKERKKQHASILRKKKEDKKRQKELEGPSELEAADGDTTVKGSTDDDTNRNTTGNDSPGQGGDSLKKKKKRKPKVKNYLLEELADTKKERLEQALRHKLDIIERRKQRKKERQLEKQKQLDKENGHAVAASGIGAKLEKVQMKKKQQAAAAADAKVATETGELSSPNGVAVSPERKKRSVKQPRQRQVLSAFAVFQQLQNGTVSDATVQKAEKTVELSSPANKQDPIKKPQSGEKSETESEKKRTGLEDKENKSEPSQNVSVEKQAESKPNGQNQKQKAKKAADSNKPPAPPAVIGKALSADNETTASKKESGIDRSEAKVSELRVSSSIQQSTSDGVLEVVTKLSKKQKRKLAMISEPEQPIVVPDLKKNATETANGGKAHHASELQNSKAKKQKKNKAPVAVELPEKKMMHVVKDDELDSMSKKKKKAKRSTTSAVEEVSVKSGADRLAQIMSEIRTDKEKKKSKKLKTAGNKPAPGESEGPSELEAKAVPSFAGATNKRKRELFDNSATLESPRPAKHTKLRVLQRIESGGFLEETVTPDKVRMKRNFGFDERQATPAKQVGFKVSSILPSDEHAALRALAVTSSKKQLKDGRSKAKHTKVVSERNRGSLPQMVWTSSGVFMESAADNEDIRKTQHGPKSATNGGYVSLKGQPGDFRLKTSSAGVEKPHRIDPATTAHSVVNFKRQQIWEKTAHLREKKKAARM